MTIIMTYHALVERDTRFIARRWKFLIILLLFGIIVCNLLAGFKIHYLDTNFKEYCFINSKIVFKPRSVIVPPLLPQSGVNLRWFDRPKNEHFHKIDQYFFDNVVIDEYATMWGNPYNCIFVSISPLFFMFCAIVWITMFLTCSHGGTTKSYVSAKPWKIVVPALIFFVIAAIATTILLIILKSAIDEFCNELNRQLKDDYYCGFLLEQFSLVDMTDYNFSRDCYSIILRTLSLAILLWVTAAIIMILRIIFVVDFQLIRVTISHLPSNEDSTTATTRHLPSNENLTTSTISQSTNKDTSYVENSTSIPSDENPTTATIRHLPSNENPTTSTINPVANNEDTPNVNNSNSVPSNENPTTATLSQFANKDTPYVENSISVPSKPNPTTATIRHLPSNENSTTSTINQVANKEDTPYVENLNNVSSSENPTTATINGHDLPSNENPTTSTINPVANKEDTPNVEHSTSVHDSTSGQVYIAFESGF